MGRSAAPDPQARREPSRSRSARDGDENGEYGGYAGRDDRREGRGGFSPAQSFPPAPSFPQDEYDARNFAHAQPLIPGVPDPGRRNGYPDANRVPPPMSPAPELEEGERMIYDPRVDGMPPPDSLIAYPRLQSPQQAERRSARIAAPSSYPGSKPFAGALVGRSNPASARSMEAKQAMRTMDREDAARRGRAFADQPAGRVASAPAPVPAPGQPRPSAPSAELGRDEDMRLDREVRAKAAAAEARRFSAMAAPSGLGLRPPPKTEVSIPARSEPQAAKQAEPSPVAPIRHDEVFTPDLFLSGD